MIEQSTTRAEAMQLVATAQRPPGEALPPGATDEDLRRFEERLGTRIPAQVRTWLGLHDGALIGDGGLFGVGPEREFLSMRARLDEMDSFASNRLLPVAGDGFGNAYVVACRGAREPLGTVLFVEALGDHPADTFVVASDFWHFLRAYLSRETGSGWPFDADAVVRNDPTLADLEPFGLPWNS